MFLAYSKNKKVNNPLNTLYKLKSSRKIVFYLSKFNILIYPFIYANLAKFSPYCLLVIHKSRDYSIYLKYTIKCFQNWMSTYECLVSFLITSL